MSFVRYKTSPINYFNISLAELTLQSILDALTEAKELGISSEYLYVSVKDYTDTIAPLIRQEWFQDEPTPLSPLKIVDNGAITNIVSLPAIEQNKLWFVSFPHEEHRKKKKCNTTSTQSSS